MRIHQAATIKHATQTGFQSACSEFAANGLSVDELLGLGNPAIHLLTINQDLPLLDIQKDNVLVIDTSRRAVYNDIVVVGERIIRFKTSSELYDEPVQGVVVAVLKELVKPNEDS